MPSGGRQKVRLRRLIGEFSSKSLPELARQVKAAIDMLQTAIGDAVDGALLRIIDGTRSPPYEQPPREKLEFRGNVTVTTTNDRNIVDVLTPDVPDAGISSATGLDGVDTSLSVDGSSLTVRSSRDILDVNIGITNQNDWAPTGIGTKDWIRIEASGTVRSITGLIAPGPNDTEELWITNVSATTALTFPHNSGSSSAGNKWLCPDGISWNLRAGTGMRVKYDRTAGVLAWRIMERSWTADIPTPISDHGGLTGLGDNDHPHYLNGAAGFDGVAVSVVSQTVLARRSKVVITVTLSADQDDWEPTGWDTADIVDINCTGRIIVSGAKAPTTNGTTIKQLRMRSTSGSNSHYLTLQDVDTSSDPENRFVCPSASDQDVLRREDKWIAYDFEIEGWRVMGTDAIQATGTRRFIADQSHGGFGITALRDAVIEGQIANPPAEPDDGDIIVWASANADGHTPGHLNVMGSAGRMSNAILVDYEDETQVGDDSGTMGWDMDQVDDRGLGDGTFKLRALMVAQNVTSPGSGSEYDIVCVERWGVYSKTGATGTGGDSQCRNMEIVSDGQDAYWEPNGPNSTATLNFVPGSGTIVGLEWDLPVPNNAHTWHRWIIVTAEGAAHA